MIQINQPRGELQDEKMWVEECFFFLSDKKVQNLALDGKNNNPIKYYEWQSN